MQTLRKKTSPLKFFTDKNETTKFLGDGVSFKAKLIGILEVSEARGDRMCQEALSDLKMAIRAAGEHKQRITVNIAIDGLRLRDEKTGDCLYHHPVHKISFIAQDMTDSRAFGYIFGSPDTGHRFFGIKTDKAASQVVIAMRDLFQVVFSLKKKEIELAKQHLEKTYLPQSPLFSEASAPPLSKITEKIRSDTKGVPSTSETKTSGTAVADLVDLELALNNLQQGLSQMEKITPSNPYGSKDDPFGDSFVYPPASSQPILPPPPSSGRERSTRTSETSNIFSPKMPHRTALTVDDHKETVTSHAKELNKLNEHFTFPREFSASITSTERSLSDDWFAAPDKFEEPVLSSEPLKDEKHEQAKQEIMSQFDVFTELDPLGTGRSKPYIDKKYFFQELKNPPKKALNELASSNSANQELFNAGSTDTGKHYSSTNMFSQDPFGEDPFVKDDPFANSDFSKQDPFHSEFVNFPTTHITNNWEKGLPTNSQIMSKPLKLTPLDKESSSVSPKNYFGGGNRGIEATFDKKLHEIPVNLDISSGSESTPEPPPRPASTFTSTETRPPPLPPKKLNDLLVKPPPRPPHNEDVRYDFIGATSEPVQPAYKQIGTEAEKGPPLPAPQRKSKFESDFSPYPERPAKRLTALSSDEDYLTPITFPEKPNNCDSVSIPPSTNKRESTITKSNDNLNNPIEGLDISLSQLTLSGLNELAAKLNIPSSQLSNMTLAQLASYISNFIKDKADKQEKLHEQKLKEQKKATDFPRFEADFSAFNNNSIPVATNVATTTSTYDKYAVFRELQEEINQISKTEPQAEPQKEDSFDENNKFEDKFEDSVQDLDHDDKKETNDDKYAALREIVEIEMQSDTFKQKEPVPSISQANLSNDSIVKDLKDSLADINKLDSDLKPIIQVAELRPIQDIEFSLDKSKSPIRSPVLRSPKSPKSPSVAKEISISARLTSGSLSDIVSGSSPEVDNTGSNSENARKGTNTDLGESWAVFDSNAPPSESLKENLCAGQSEEGVSPWSSDSKEFGNSSPVEWKKDDGEEQWKNSNKKDQDGWWDTSAEPEAVYNPANRRSTDSYEEEYYECYERPRRPRRQWQHGAARQPAGGHSSSSRDVSPWEEEPNRREGWQRPPKGLYRDRRADSWDEEDDYEYENDGRGRGHYFDRHNSRESERRSSGGSRDMDSERWAEGWNEERRSHRRRRDGSREMVRGELIDKDRWCCVDWKRGDRDRPERDRPERDRPERDRPERDRAERERPERDRPERDVDKSRRYPRKATSERRERNDDRYRSSRESQESPWEDEYDPESRHYLSVGNRKNWKQRPSSASEMERKSAEMKARSHLGTGGSDGEKDRRYNKGTRRSRSRDSHYSEPPVRHKPETSSTRSQYRNKQHGHSRTLDLDYGDVGLKKPIPDGTGSLKKPLPSSKQDRTKKSESPRDGASKSITSTSLPRKGTDRSKSMFDADYEPTKDSPSPSQWEGGKFDFEVEFLPESGSVIAHKKDEQNLTLPAEWLPFPKPTNIEKENDDLKPVKSPSYKDQRSISRQQKSRSPFEDDFSPSDKLMEGNGISSIKEETDVAEDTEDENNRFAPPKPPIDPQRKPMTTAPPKHRLSSSGRTNVNISKSESVNIFSMENDPFDDEFFSQPPDEMKSSDYSWTDRFPEYGTRRK